MYLSVASLTVPTVCDPVTICIDDTKTPVGTILIRPRIEAPDKQDCQSAATTNYPYGFPISESLYKLLVANNFNTSVYFGNDDLTKWDVRVYISTTCNHVCGGEYQKFAKVYEVLDSDYKIVRITTDNLPSFAIELKNVPVMRNLAINVQLREPCKNYSLCPTAPGACNRFANVYEKTENYTDVRDGREIRMTLDARQGSTLSCADCQ